MATERLLTCYCSGGPAITNSQKHDCPVSHPAPGARFVISDFLEEVCCTGPLTNTPLFSSNIVSSARTYKGYC